MTTTKSPSEIGRAGASDYILSTAGRDWLDESQIDAYLAGYAPALDSIDRECAVKSFVREYRRLGGDVPPTPRRTGARGRWR